jgi:precorrin-2 dehydrogenase/sirohydrochlorin ferrochelatase
MAFAYPVNLDLTDRRCVVIGMLPVREGKVQGLLAGGCTDVMVLVGDGDHSPRLDALEGLDGVRLLRREWRAGDLDAAFLVIAHDPDPRIREDIAGEAHRRGALVNIVDDVRSCDFAMPALLRRGRLTIAIGTGGTSPALARRIRERLDSDFGPEWDELSRIIGEVRANSLHDASFAERSRLWTEALDLDQASEMVRSDRGEELRELLHARLAGRAAS